MRIEEQEDRYSRRYFIQSGVLLLAGILQGNNLKAWNTHSVPAPSPAFTLKPIGRTLQLDEFYIWCSSPIWGEDGRVHLFYSRWKKEKGMSGWIRGSEIAHAIADTPYSSFKHHSVVLQPRPGHWDSTTCHNPLIKKIDGKYYLFYMGNSNGKTDTKRIGVAYAERLEGPWHRPDQPCLLPGATGSWDDHCTTNPALLRGHDGKYWMFYKSWNTSEYQQATGAVRGNRKYGLAKADHPLGPYEKVSDNAVIDFSDRPNNAQLEDAFVWEEDGTYFMVARDMGFYNHEFGLLLSSKDGINWSEPKVAYLDMKSYVSEGKPAPHLKRFGRLERPMFLLDEVTGRPRFLFGATQGGDYATSTAFVFEILSYKL
ncbi:glycosyl hydrolase family 43 [Sphingobacterium allocomposti]|uniref:Glycosyl hydrolase family 43 n=2 Tax=Sphingobacterium allocomposti TaxID=415956 RepID=A0A5S5DRA9_9SPHI|nr:glycosyl hydrolase family 43 [Sphingobacterium composti Yoo et al. 2007 non Ten et al. 2007]